MAKELYVGHLSEETTEEDLRRLFSVMGTVTSVHLIIDPETREFKRCGYVRMAADVDLKEVVETLDGAFLVDRVITVSIARPQKPGMSGKAGMSGRGKRTDSRPLSGTGPKSRPEPKQGQGRKPAERPGGKDSRAKGPKPRRP
jgi:RNA recognition motif-containing protein